MTKVKVTYEVGVGNEKSISVSKDGGDPAALEQDARTLLPSGAEVLSVETVD